MKAVYNISYGLYILTVNDGNKHTGCVINTLMQVTPSPSRISITINKDNYTTDIISKTGVFNVSILDMSTNFDIIKRFGFASGKDIDKFVGFNDYNVADNGVAYITKHTNSYISAKVVSSSDVGTHITFVADIDKDVVLSDTKSLTYAYYLDNIKPKVESTDNKKYVCSICGFEYEGDTLPDDYICPLCKHGAEFFELK